MIKNFSPTRYLLKSLLNGSTFKDTGWLLESPGEEGKTLIRAIYNKKQLDVGPPEHGIYRFSDWLPIQRTLVGSSAPVTFKSSGLAGELGLKNLWITFSGYWPEKEVYMKTCSFKETEAYSVCGRMSDKHKEILVVASAGNTARAFARVCSDNNIPLLLCVPEDNINSLWFDSPLSDSVKLVVSRSGGDYFDAIHLSNLAAGISGFVAEGGAKNVARRDGMGTTVLSAVTTIGQIPDYYYQAIGSGTGAIAAWEANLRLIEDGRFGSNKMKLMVSQNHPFTPIRDAWEADSRAMLALDDDLARKQVEEIVAKVLSNRKPPYPIIGGLYDALKDAGGSIPVATNEEAEAAAHVFEKTEGIDIHPAAAIATATLIRDARDHNITPDATVMLNITGGGEARFARDHQLYFLKPSLVFDINPDEAEVRASIKALF